MNTIHVPQTSQATRLTRLVAESRRPILASFHDSECSKGACSTQGRHIGTLETALQGIDADFIDIDVDAFPALAEAYGVETLPFAVLIVDGEVRESMTGLTDPGVIACALLRHVPNGEALMARSGHICPLSASVA